MARRSWIIEISVNDSLDSIKRRRWENSRQSMQYARQTLTILGIIFGILLLFSYLELGRSAKLKLRDIAELWHEEHANFTVDFKLWTKPNDEGYHQCIQRPKNTEWNPGNATDGYIMVRTSGGLNQMKMGICDMAAIAKLMNATLVLPHRDNTSDWSQFGDIFDTKHFINTLKDDVRIVERLPSEYEEIEPHVVKPVSWSEVSYYEKLAETLKKKKVIRFIHTDSRLANNHLPSTIQKLRCRACYEALRFVPEIGELGKRIVSRLRSKSSRSHYVALHLRYEKDVVAFSGCNHGLTPSQEAELRLTRLSLGYWKQKDMNSEERRRQGKCPMTPREAVAFLKAMGYPRDTIIYIVAVEVYGSNSMKVMREEYPNIYTHTSLTTFEEMGLLKTFYSRLAALDYIVAFNSDVFVDTHNDNMGRAVQGHRRFDGHRMTISPDRQKLMELIDMLDEGKIGEVEFGEKVKLHHQNRTGNPYERQPGVNPKQEEHFYANPLPGCICT